MLDPSRYFICGNSTDPASDGMAKHLVVCPAYGADWTVIYVHSDEVVKLRKALEYVQATAEADGHDGFVDFCKTALSSGLKL